MFILIKDNAQKYNGRIQKFRKKGPEYMLFAMCFFYIIISKIAGDGEGVEVGGRLKTHSRNPSLNTISFEKCYLGVIYMNPATQVRTPARVNPSPVKRLEFCLLHIFRLCITTCPLSCPVTSCFPSLKL